MRPDQDEPFAIVSNESTTNTFRTADFDDAARTSGRIQPQIAAPEIKIASGITAYSSALSRRLPSLPFTVSVATGSAVERLGGTSAECSVDADRSCEASSCTPDTLVAALA